MNIDGAALPDDDQLQLGFEDLNTDLARVEASLPLPSAEDGAVPEDPKPAPEPAPWRQANKTHRVIRRNLGNRHGN